MGKGDSAPAEDWEKFTETLREVEKDIAADLKGNEMAAEEWERIRQWPGEKHPGGHLHISERCEHGAEKWNCGHRISDSEFRVRIVLCEESFCLWANEREEEGQGEWESE